MLSPDDLANTLELNNFHPLEITLAHATMAGTLPRQREGNDEERVRLFNLGPKTVDKLLDAP